MTRCIVAAIYDSVHDFILMIMEEKRLKKTFLALAMIGTMAFSLTAYGGESETADNAESTKETAKSAADAENVGEAPDYSRAECWYQIPEITKDVDTFYIYATEYIDSSYNEGAPDYATLDNPEMLEKVPNEYMAHASTFEDSTNVFVPYYRQPEFFMPFALKLYGSVKSFL